MQIWYIENEIDFKYQVPFLKALGSKLPDTFKIYYRKIPGLVSFSDFLNNDVTDLSVYKSLAKEAKKFKTIPKLLKILNTQENATLVTGYNFKKRGVEKYTNIKVINIGHSISGNTSYNLKVWVNDNNPRSTSIVPSFFKLVKRPSGVRRKAANGKIYSKLFYKLIYLLRETEALKLTSEVKEGPKTILFLPHWSMPMSNVKRMVEAVDIPEDAVLKVKLHPASIYETTIFLNRTNKETPTTSLEDDERSKKLLKLQYEAMVQSINDIPRVSVFNDDELELIDAMDQADYLIFDGCSNTLTESIFRSIRFNTNQKIAVLDPKVVNPSYDLPDLFGYKFLDAITSIEDFKAPNVELMTSYMDISSDTLVDDIVNEYSGIINKLLAS